jgi:RHO1 GDP-GTP exchange protein 1/2
VTDFRRVLNFMNPTSLAALTGLGHKTFNRLVVHADSAVMTYSLDILARLALDRSQLQSLDASVERVGGSDVNIVFCKHIHFDNRALCSYLF